MTVNQVGYRAGLAAVVATVAYDVVQILQVMGVIRFPLDDILIFGTSLCIVVPVVLEMLALHHLSTGERRYWAQAAVVFTTMYAVFVSTNYVVQLTTVLPARLRGAADAVRVLEQTPHSMFWDYDAMGYIALGVATLFAAFAIPNAGFGRWVRRSLVANTLVTPLIATVYFYPTFSIRLLFIGFPWAVTAPLFMLMLAILLRDVQQSPTVARTRPTDADVGVTYADRE